MSDIPSPHPHETRPVGRTPTDQQRNAELLSGYDYDAYVESLTGYTGQDLQRVGFVRWEPAVRVRVGPRGSYKAGFTRLPDGILVLAVCRDNNAPDPAAREILLRSRALAVARGLNATWLALAVFSFRAIPATGAALQRSLPNRNPHRDESPNPFPPAYRIE